MTRGRFDTTSGPPPGPCRVCGTEPVVVGRVIEGRSCCVECVACQLEFCGAWAVEPPGFCSAHALAHVDTPETKPLNDDKRRWPREHVESDRCIAPECRSADVCRDRGCRVVCTGCGADTGDFVRRHECAGVVSVDTPETK